MEMMTAADAELTDRTITFYEGVAYALGIRLDPPLHQQSRPDQERIIDVLERVRKNPDVSTAEAVTVEDLLARFPEMHNDIREVDPEFDLPQ